MIGKSDVSAAADQAFADRDRPDVTHYGYGDPPQAFCGAPAEVPKGENGRGGRRRDCPVCITLWNVYDRAGYVPVDPTA